jgi:hypothetical protein
MNDIIKLACTEIEVREEGFQVIWFSYSSRNTDSVSCNGNISIACGFDRTFEIGKDYDLNLEEIV